MDWLKRLQEPKFLLLGIAVAIAAIHLTLIDRADKAELFATAALFWIAFASLLWDRRDDLTLESGLFANIVGVSLLAIFCLVSSTLPTSVTFLHVSPFMAVLGLACLASGFQRLRQYWRELAVFAMLALNPALQLLLQTIDLSSMTAKFSTLVLWYTGFPIQRQGLFLILPTGRVEVYEACSGLHSILQMLNIAVLFLLMFTLRLLGQKLLCVALAVIVGFVVNSARVALMAILVAFSQKDSFEYWHSGNGSLVFSMIAVAVFGIICWFLFLRIPKDPPKDPPNEGVQVNG